jgi:phage terminase small subunit
MQNLKFDQSVQAPPPHLRAAGCDLWHSTLQEWDLSDADLLILCTACECLDRLSEIRAELAADGVILTDPSGRKRSHPLLAAESQTHGVLLRAWSLLDLNDAEPPKVGRPATRL